MEKVDYSHRTGKDFTPEEKTMIVSRAKQIGTRKAAEEFGTSYWVVKYLRYYDKNAPIEGRSRTKKKVPEKVKQEKVVNTTNKTEVLKYDVKDEEIISKLRAENEVLKERVNLLSARNERLKETIFGLIS